MMQTLEGFLSKPFGKPEIKSNEYEAKYRKLRDQRKIYMEACTEVGDTYLVHIKVGSETNSTLYYDVVLLFFTDDAKVKKDISFRRYYVKFFSNSPSFIYQYAVLYKQNGMMIDMLAEKMDQMYADKLPEKANPSLKMSYDKSIYMTCRFMQDHKVSAFSKVGFMARRKKNADNFFADIKTFEDVKFTNELHTLERKMETEAKKDRKKEDVSKMSDGSASRKDKARKGVTVAKRIKATSAAPKVAGKKSTSTKKAKQVKTVKRK